MSEKAGRWRPGLEAKLPGNASTKQRLVELESVSCPSPGSCTAVGGFFDKTGNSESLLLSESAGRWRTALKATLPSNATATHKFSDDSAFLLAVSCASAGHCSAVGNYCAIGRCNRIGGSGGAGQQGLLLTETRGRWARGVEAKLPGNAAGAGPLLYLNSISCASAGNCSATGSYFESPQKTHLVLLTEKAARWTRGIDPALPADAATGAAQDDLGVNSISCSSPGNCTAAGTYSGIGSDNTRPMLLTETTGEWSRGVEVALPRNASTPYQYSWLTVSCTSSQNCSGVGFYTDSSNFQQGLLLSNATPAPLGKRR